MGITRSLRRRRLVGGLAGLTACTALAYGEIGCHSPSSNGKPDPSPYQLPSGNGEGDADTARSLDGGPRVLNCDAGLAACDGTCVDLQNDLLNCGACAHGCLGAPCSAGKCQPVTLVSGQADPGAIALDDTYVYFTNVTGGDDGGTPGSIVRIPKLGGPTTTLAAAQILPSAIAVDATDVYWTSRAAGTGAIYRCALAGCTLTAPTAVATGLNAPDWLALDATSVYYTTGGSGGGGDAGADAGAADGTVSAVGKDGQKKRDIITGQNTPVGLSIDEAHVFFATHLAAGSIVRCPLTGPCTNPITLVPPQDLPARIVLDGTAAFWTNNGGSLGRVDKTGDGYREIATGGSPTRLAVDASSIYWTDGPGKSVTRATKDGQRITVIASGQSDPLSIAVDDTAVYWTNRGGQVMRLAK